MATLKRKASSQLTRLCEHVEEVEDRSVSASAKTVELSSQNTSTSSGSALGTQEKSATATKFSVIDKYADLQLIFESNGESLGLLVCRRTTCRASPVFKAMLAKDSRCLESITIDDTKDIDCITTIRLPNDDIDIMQIIMYAIHCEGDEVPQSVDFHQLEQIAILCDKYDLRRSLGAWPKVWMEPYYQSIEKDGYERFLFIATVFHSTDIILRITKHLIMTTTISTDGHLLDHAGHTFTDGVPNAITGTFEAL